MPGAPGLCLARIWEPYPFPDLTADARQHHFQHIQLVGAVTKAHLAQGRGTDPHLSTVGWQIGWCPNFQTSLLAKHPNWHQAQEPVCGHGPGHGAGAGCQWPGSGWWGHPEQGGLAGGPSTEGGDRKPRSQRSSRSRGSSWDLVGSKRWPPCPSWWVGVRGRHSACMVQSDGGWWGGPSAGRVTGAVVRARRCQCDLNMCHQEGSRCPLPLVCPRPVCPCWPAQRRPR